MRELRAREPDIENILYEMYEVKNMRLTEIAKHFGVSTSAIMRIYDQRITNIINTHRQNPKQL